MPIDTSLANEVWSRYTWLRDNGHLNYVKKANKCEDFFAGMQWEPADLQLLRDSRRPALTINKIISTIANVLGEQIFNRTDVAFKPRNDGASAEVADALTKVFMQISDNNQLSWVRSDVFADGVVGSRGFFDVRLDFDDSLRGEVRIKQLNPKNVLIDGDADDYDPDKWGDVLVTKWMSVDQIEMLYSKKDADLLRGRSDSYLPYGYDSIDYDRDRFGVNQAVHQPEMAKNDAAKNIRVIERQYKKLDRVNHFVDVNTGDLRVIPSDWDDNRVSQHLEQNPHLSVTKKLIQRIRWTVVADEVVLHDDWSLYKHFTVVPYFPFFRRGRTVGLVENLLGPQELLNKVSSQELHVVNTSANSGWLVKRNALQNMSVGELEQRGAKTGLVLELDDIANAQKISPNTTPTGLDRISYKAEEHIKSISGVSDYMQGFAREDVSAKSVVANQKSGQANLAKVMDNLSRTDFILARNVLDIVQEYYTEQRLMYITTDRLTQEQEQLVVNQRTPEGIIVNDLTVGEYAVVVTNQPERDTFEDSQFEQALRLRTEAGIAIPDKYLIQSSRLKDRAEIIRELEGGQDPEAEQAQAQMQQRVQEAEVAKIEAEAAQKQADAQLRMAKGQSEMQNTGQQELELERMKLEMQMQMEMKRLEMEMALKREQMQMEIELKREQARMTADDKVMADRVAAVERARSQQSKPPTNPSTKEKKQ